MSRVLLDEVRRVGVDLRATGLNLERMGLAGLKGADLESFILTGRRQSMR